MATIKSYSDLQQSKKLAEILPLESADMWYEVWHKKSGRDDAEWDDVVEYTVISETPVLFDLEIYKKYHKNKSLREMEGYPCWSLTALLEQLNMPTLFRDFDGWTISCLSPSSHMPMIKSGFASPIDACVAMIEKLHKMKML